MKKISLVFAAMAALGAASCTTITNADPINEEASLPDSFGFSRTEHKVIAIFFDKKKGTMATLYGNDPAFESAADTLAGNGPGEEYTMITWKSGDNPEWFGGKSPAALLEVEVIKIVGGENGNERQYSRYVGKELAVAAPTAEQFARVDYILSQRATVFP